MLNMNTKRGLIKPVEGAEWVEQIWRIWKNSNSTPMAPESLIQKKTATTAGYQVFYIRDGQLGCRRGQTPAGMTGSGMVRCWHTPFSLMAPSGFAVNYECGQGLQIFRIVIWNPPVFKCWLKLGKKKKYIVWAKETHQQSRHSCTLPLCGLYFVFCF